MQSIELIVNFGESMHTQNQQPLNKNDSLFGQDYLDNNTTDFVRNVNYMPMKRSVDGNQPFPGQYDDLSTIFEDLEHGENDELSGCKARRFKEKTVLKPYMMKRQSSAPQPCFDEQISFKSSMVAPQVAPELTKKESESQMAQELVNGKRRRGRKESAFDTYNQTTRNTISELEKKIADLEKQPKKDKKTNSEIKRLKNMVSAYESRLLKRAIKEDLRAQVDTQNQQIACIMSIIKQELTSADLLRVTQRIINETPAMKPFVNPK